MQKFGHGEHFTNQVWMETGSDKLQHHRIFRIMSDDGDISGETSQIFCVLVCTHILGKLCMCLPNMGILVSRYEEHDSELEQTVWQGSGAASIFAQSHKH